MFLLIFIKRYKNGTEVTHLYDRFEIFQDNSTLLVKKGEESDIVTFKCQSKTDPTKFREIDVFGMYFPFFIYFIFQNWQEILIWEVLTGFYTNRISVSLVTNQVHHLVEK